MIKIQNLLANLFQWEFLIARPIVAIKYIQRYLLFKVFYIAFAPFAFIRHNTVLILVTAYLNVTSFNMGTYQQIFNIS